jgi:methylmalonyl-CoA/ethylmalonyl-CoA epimerase
MRRGTGWYPVEWPRKSLLIVTMIQAIDHLGIAVRSLDEAVPLYERALGLKCLGREEVASQKVRTAFFDAGGVHLELLEPTAPESPIAKFINDRGEGIHHVAFRTDDITGQLKQAADAGVRLIHDQPFDGAAGKLVAFLHPKSTRGVLTELCALKPGDRTAH